MFFLFVGDPDTLNNSSLHIGIFCLFKTMDIYTTHSYLIFRLSMFWTNMSKTWHNSPVFFHLSEGGSNLKIIYFLKRCVFVGRDASDEYAQLLGKLQWLKYSPLPKKRTSKRIDKKNTTSYPIRGWRIFQMITSFFEAIAWFFPFVGIILIIYFPVPWAESQIFWLSPTKKQVPCLVIRNCGPVEQKGDTLR